MTVVAIDGPAASGKSTVARLVARRLGFGYVNSGAMYRAITWHLVQSGVDLLSSDAVAEALRVARIECGLANGVSEITIDGVNPEQHLQSGIVNANVSHVSGLPSVRQVLLERLRAFAEEHDIVMEGRDIGTVVFPETPWKFYLDACPEVRQKRRNLQGQADVVTLRDRQDSSRRAAPLAAAADATILDTTYLTLEEVVTEIIGCLARMGLTVPKS